MKTLFPNSSQMQMQTLFLFLAFFCTFLKGELCFNKTMNGTTETCDACMYKSAQGSPCGMCSSDCYQKGYHYSCCCYESCCCYSSSGLCSSNGNCPATNCSKGKGETVFKETTKYCMCSSSQLDFCHKTDSNSGCECDKCDSTGNCVSYYCT